MCSRLHRDHSEKGAREMDIQIDFLRKINLFLSLSGQEFDHIVRRFHPVEVEAGQTLFKEGDRGNELFIVKSGKVAISVRLRNGLEQEIVEFCSGEFFGEMSIFEKAPRSATCYTKEKSSLLTLYARDFFQLMKHHPNAAIKIMYGMLNTTTQRLRDTDEFLSDMVLWGERARKRAITDELTGVYNRRFLDDALEDLFRTSKEKKKPLSFVMVDLDYFREINEAYGHQAGDRVIIEAVSVFRKHLRRNDIIARYGGDEFTFILPETAAEEARQIAENICREMKDLALLKEYGGSITQITTSQGIACFPEHARDPASLHALADQALYRAKKEGRNRVVCWSE